MSPARWIAAIVVLASSPGAYAQTWSPQRNVELVVSTAPGGSNYKTARLIEKILVDHKMLGATLAVVNKPGAGGAVTNAYMNQFAGNAHYLFIGTPNLVSQHILGVSTASYKDFTPVVSLFNDYVVLAVNAGSPIKTGKDLMERLKTKPEGLTIGFASALGNHHHIAAGLVTKAVGGNVRGLRLVVFKGSADAIVALLGGHIDLVSAGAVNTVAHVAAGKMRVLGVAAPQRLGGVLAGVPTWREQGADVVYGSWRAVIGSRNLTAPQLAYWEGVMRKVSETPEWKTDLDSNYWSSYFQTGAQFTKSLDREYAETRAVLAEIGLIK